MVTFRAIRRLDSLIVKLDRLVPAEQQAARLELKVTLLNVQNGAKKRVKVDRGDLRNRIAHETSDSGLTGRVGTNAEHGPPVEFGRRAGARMPPVDEIRDWAKRKGIKDYKRAAFVIARAIAARGIPASPFLFPEFEKERLQFLSRLASRLNDAHRTVARGGAPSGAR